MNLKPTKVLRPHNAFSQIISQSLLFRETLKLQRGDSCLLNNKPEQKENQQPSLVKGMADFQNITRTRAHILFTTWRDPGGCLVTKNIYIFKNPHKTKTTK